MNFLTVAVALCAMAAVFMMINLLPEEVWGRIAAGEVVERPASAVKELVENSLDIGARRIRVSLWDGGKTRIVVEDDGAGIPFAELPLAVAQHATSKLSTTDDLNAILTLGYRGEALASVAAVSRLEIRSRSGGEEGGLIRVHEGKISEHIPTACAPGTRVQIDDLFFNLPARQKFLKAALSELKRAANVIRDYAMAWPGVSFGLNHDGKQFFSTDGGGDRGRTLAQLWGISPAARAVNVSSGNLSLECWHQFFPGRGRNEVSAFVNGRSVNDPLIRSAVGTFGKELSGNWALFFTINPSFIDVNIHPAKAEIRFRYTGEVFEALKKASEALAGPTPLISAQPVRENAKFSAAFKIPQKSENLFTKAPSWDEPLRSCGAPPLKGEATSLSPSPFMEMGREPARNELRESPSFSIRGQGGEVFVAQTKTGYLIFEDENSLVLMDPHAAHERIMFEKIRAISKGNFKTQKLLIEEILPPTLAIEVREHREELQAHGFKFQDGISGEISVAGIPDVLNAAPVLNAVRATISVWNAGGEKNIDELLAARWATLACKASVKLTAHIGEGEALSLRRQLHECEQPFACPHGRPTLLTIENSDLTKHFGRSES